MLAGRSSPLVPGKRALLSYDTYIHTSRLAVKCICSKGAVGTVGTGICALHVLHIKTIYSECSAVSKRVPSPGIPHVLPIWWRTYPESGKVHQLTVPPTEEATKLATSYCMRSLHENRRSTP